MALFRLDASIRTEGSVSRAVADSVESSWREVHPGAAVIERDLTAQPIPAAAWQDAVGGAWVAPEERTPAQAAAVALAATLADELAGSRAFLFAVPLYNFGISQHFKLWIDLLLTDPRFAPGVEPLLAGRPATLVAVRGGGYGPGTPRAGWDHGTPYVQRVLTDVLGLDVHLVEAELTLADVSPQMEELRPMAAELQAKAHLVAAEHGRTIAAKVGAVPAA